MNRNRHNYIIWKLKPKSEFVMGGGSRNDNSFFALVFYRSAVAECFNVIGKSDHEMKRAVVSARYWWELYLYRRKASRLGQGDPV